MQNKHLKMFLHQVNKNIVQKNAENYHKILFNSEKSQTISISFS